MNIRVLKKIEFSHVIGQYDQAGGFLISLLLFFGECTAGEF
jgi:hypothetical protein